MRFLRALTDSIRARLALAAGLSVVLVVVFLGVALVRATERADGRVLDRQLERRADLLTASAVAASRTVAPGPRAHSLGAALLANNGAGVRVLDNRRELLAAGSLPPAAARTSAPDAGLGTIHSAAGDWRVDVRPAAGTAVVLQVFASLRDEEARAQGLRRRLLLLGSVGGLLAAALAAIITAVTSRSLGRVREAATRIAATRELGIRVGTAGPREVREVAGALNVMLDQVQTAAADRERVLAAARAFVADAGHELRTPLATMRANLETLERNPELEPSVRAEIVADTLAEQQRLFAMAEALQMLARGEAGALGDEGIVDLVELAATAVAAVRVRHPNAEIDRAGLEHASVYGSPTGLRLVFDNVLENSARHAGQDRPPVITVTVERYGEQIRTTVDDDGPGIPEQERSLVTDRFRRGRSAAAGGSGLGLAIVAQQVAIHGGSLRLADAPAGGARVEVTIPAAVDAGARA